MDQKKPTVNADSYLDNADFAWSIVANLIEQFGGEVTLVTRKGIFETKALHITPQPNSQNIVLSLTDRQPEEQ